MKRTLRILTAMVLTVFMVMSVSMTAFAEEETYTVTMKRASGDKTAHIYEAYQVFKGDLSGNGVLSNVEWGSGVNSTTLLAALKADTFAYKADFAACATAKDVAKALDQKEDDSDFAKAFAAAVGKNLSATKAGTASISEGGNDNTTADISYLEAGYYFIKDQDGTQTNKDYGNYTRFILKVVKDETVKAKADFPTLDKKIFENNTEKEANTASIGDVITFKLTSKVPDRTGFNKYYFIVNDTLCKGLTYLHNTMTVTVAGNDYDKTFTPTAERNNDGTTSLKIVLKDFVNAAGNTGDKIVITYQAVLNEKADITSAGNPNTANLTYSNDPNHEYKGEDEPNDDGDVTGKTPDVTTKTFTTGIKLTKVDGEDNTIELKGAKFQINGDGGLSAVLINNEIYKANTNGAYYMLKDGSFTTDEPTTETEKKYDSKTTKYSKIVNVTKDTATATSPVNNIAYTDKNGVITFVGLGEGDYTITELDAPEGYNKLKNPIEISISANVDQTTQTCAWTVVKDGDNEHPLTAPDNLFGFTVENNEGITLPGTGGIGTTIFYVVGGLLIICAVALLVTKVRMAHKEK